MKKAIKYDALISSLARRCDTFFFFQHTLEVQHSNACSAFIIIWAIRVALE